MTYVWVTDVYRYISHELHDREKYSDGRNTSMSHDEIMDMIEDCLFSIDSIELGIEHIEGNNE